MTATYTDNQAGSEGLQGRSAKPGASRRDFVMTSSTPELTSTPDVPGKWSASAKLKLILGSCLAFWILMAAFVAWLVN
jgi:hypothetical protein